MTKGAKTGSALDARIKAYEQHGKNPQGQNPSNANGTGHDMHKPGSRNRKKGYGGKRR